MILIFWWYPVVPKPFHRSLIIFVSYRNHKMIINAWGNLSLTHLIVIASSYHSISVYIFQTYLSTLSLPIESINGWYGNDSCVNSTAALNASPPCNWWLCLHFILKQLKTLILLFTVSCLALKKFFFYLQDERPRPFWLTVKWW